MVVALLGLTACGGSGGGSDTAGKVAGGGGIRVAEVVARTDPTHQPVDAAPSPDGAVIYFVATGEPGPALFSVPAGGGAVAKIVDGAPLVKPSGLTVATDGSHLYVADQQADTAGAPGPGGGVLTLPTQAPSGAPTLLPGTAGRSPHGLDIVKQNGADSVYFTGTDPANGAPGLFQVPAVGGTVTTVAEGPPFISPDSVVVTGTGVAYVSDQGTGPGQGQVFSVSSGKATPVLTGQTLGAPAGVALVKGDATLLVSSVDSATRSDQVLFLDVATGKTTTSNHGIAENKNSSGGLHRAVGSPILAWCDVGRSGKVYRIEP